MQSLAHTDVATTAMARHTTRNIVAGLGYFWAIAQLVGHYNPSTACNWQQWSSWLLRGWWLEVQTRDRSPNNIIIISALVLALTLA